MRFILFEKRFYLWMNTWTWWLNEIIFFIFVILNSFWKQDNCHKAIIVLHSILQQSLFCILWPFLFIGALFPLQLKLILPRCVVV